MTETQTGWAIWHIVLGGSDWVRDGEGEILTWPTEAQADAARAAMIPPRTEWDGPRGVYRVFELLPGRAEKMTAATDAYGKWAQREAELAALEDPDEVDAAREAAGQPVRDLHGERLFAEMSRKYIPPGSRGHSAKSKRFGGKEKGGKRLEGEAWQ